MVIVESIPECGDISIENKAIDIAVKWILA
jgi:hypothetical protein